MRTQVVDHPLVAHKLTALRDENTDSPTFRSLADELVTLLAYEATREVRVEPVDIVTPVAPTTGVKLAAPKPLVVPILRAGLGMLDGMMRLLPTAEVGFLGMARDEETLEAVDVRRAAAREPRRAGSASCSTRCSRPAAPWPRPSTSSPGAARTTSPRSACSPRRRAARGSRGSSPGSTSPVTVVTAAMDERLNEKGYIVPGLGDAGDRLYGVVG